MGRHTEHLPHLTTQPAGTRADTDGWIAKGAQGGYLFHHLSVSREPSSYPTQHLGVPGDSPFPQLCPNWLSWDGLGRPYMPHKAKGK